MVKDQIMSKLHWIHLNRMLSKITTNEDKIKLNLSLRNTIIVKLISLRGKKSKL